MDGNSSKAANVHAAGVLEGGDSEATSVIKKARRANCLSVSRAASIVQEVTFTSQSRTSRVAKAKASVVIEANGIEDDTSGTDSVSREVSNEGRIISLVLAVKGKAAREKADFGLIRQGACGDKATTIMWLDGEAGRVI